TIKMYKETQQMPGMDGRSINHIFDVIVDDKKAQLVPGYAAGTTITVLDDKVSGQSMAIRFGAMQGMSQAVASQDAYDFALEAIGKPKPTKKDAAVKEAQEFSQAINRAFMLQQPQLIRYPNIKAQVVISFSR